MNVEAWCDARSDLISSAGFYEISNPNGKNNDLVVHFPNPGETVPFPSNNDPVYCSQTGNYFVVAPGDTTVVSVDLNFASFPININIEEPVSCYDLSKLSTQVNLPSHQESPEK